MNSNQNEGDAGKSWAKMLIVLGFILVFVTLVVPGILCIVLGAVMLRTSEELIEATAQQDTVRATGVFVIAFFVAVFGLLCMGAALAGDKLQFLH